MVVDHGAAGTELKQLASGKGVQLEDKAGKHDWMREKLGKLQGGEFDRDTSRRWSRITGMTSPSFAR
jgi:hypothetical protein